MAKPICVHVGAKHWAHGPCPPQTAVYIIRHGVEPWQGHTNMLEVLMEPIPLTTAAILL